VLELNFLETSLAEEIYFHSSIHMFKMGLQGFLLVDFRKHKKTNLCFLQWFVFISFLFLQEFLPESAQFLCISGILIEKCSF